MASPNTSSNSSSAQLVADLHRVAKQAQKCIRYRAILACVAVVLTVLGLLMLLDCLFQREESGLRWLASILLLTVTIYAVYRWLGPIGRLVIGPSDVARWLEAHQPEWAGRILTTFELSQLQQSDSRFGSEAFRAAALQNWQQDSLVPQWDRLLDKSRLRQATWAVIALLSILLLSFVVWPDMGFRSLARVLAPWADRPWPRRDQLQFVNLPSAVGRETILQVEVADASPPLPENITVEIRQVDAEESVQSINTQIVGDVAVANLPPINSDIQVRAIGGDDLQMSWQTIRAVTTPAWKQFHFEIKPPDYLRSVPTALERLTKQLDQATGRYELVGQRIQIVEGSSVRFEGKLDASVSDVSIRLVSGTANASPMNLESSSVSQLSRAPWTVELLAPDTVALRGEADNPMAVVDRSLVWKFQIKSLEGVQLECPEKWQIEVIPDSPPEVALNPMLLKSVTLGANLHFEGAARDDWGLSQLAAKLVVNEQNESEIELPLPIEPQFAKQVAIQQSWNIVAALEAKGLQLKAQDQVTFWVEAKDLRGQTVRSSAEKLYVDSKQKQLDAIANRQGSVAQQIGELLKMQQSAQQLARRNADSIKQSAAQPTQQQIDAATSVAQMQQTIQQQLAEATQSVLSSIESQLDLIQQNNLNDSPLASQLNTLKSRVNELADGPALDALKQADQLQRALESAVASKQAANSAELTSALDNSQSKTNQALSNLLEGLDRSELENRQREKLLQIAEQQAEVVRRTNQLGLNSNQRPQEAQVEAEQVGAAQNELAGAMEQWLAFILQPPSPIDSTPVEQTQQSVLRDVAKNLVDQNTASQMRSSGSSLRAQQLGEALQTQKQIQQALQAAIDKMTPRESSELMNDLAEQEQQLRELAKAAGQLATAQQQLARRMAGAKSAAEADRMAQEQRDLLETTKQLAQQLLSDQIADQLIQQAMANQDQAAQSAQEKQLDRSADQASAAAGQLSDLVQRVQQQAQNASQQVQRQQIFDLISAVEQIALRQKELMPQYNQLVGQLQLPALPADHVQLRQALVHRQAAVRDQLRQVTPSVEQLAVFQWVLGQADGDLSRAIAAAERNRLQPDAVNAAAAGLRKLEIAINTVKEKSNSQPNESENQDQQQSVNAQDQTQQEESLPPIVSLKLIRALQLELKQQTELLESSTGGDQGARANELMGQQRELAELLESFINDLQAQQQNNN